MRQYNGYNPQLSSGARKVLPAGGYIARIIGARTENTQYGDRLIIEYDICEGEYTGFFQEDYDRQNSTANERKWRGVYRANWPNGDGTERDDFRISIMNNVIAAIQVSNAGFVWAKNGNLDERELRGKIVGVLYREKEWEMNGRTGWTTECCKLTDAELIRNNEFEIPAKKSLNRNNQPGGYGQSSNNGSYASSYSDADAPPPRGGYNDYSGIELPF